MSDDPNAPHWLVRDLEDLDDFAQRDEPSDEDAPAQPETFEQHAQPETFEQPTQPAQRARRPSHVTAARADLPARARARGIACVIIQYSDGRRVVLS